MGILKGLAWGYAPPLKLGFASARDPEVLWNWDCFQFILHLVGMPDHAVRINANCEALWTHIWLQIHRWELFFLSELRPRQVSLLHFLAGQQIFLTYPVTESIALWGSRCHFAKWLSLTSVWGLAYWACSGFYFPVGFKSLVYSGYWNPNYQEALHFFFTDILQFL